MPDSLYLLLKTNQQTKEALTVMHGGPKSDNVSLTKKPPHGIFNDRAMCRSHSKLTGFAITHPMCSW